MNIFKYLPFGYWKGWWDGEKRGYADGVRDGEFNLRTSLSQGERVQELLLTHAILDERNQLTKEEIDDIRLIVQHPSFPALRVYFAKQARQSLSDSAAKENNQLAKFGGWILEMLHDIELIRKLDEPAEKQPYDL